MDTDKSEILTKDDIQLVRVEIQAVLGEVKALTVSAVYYIAK